MEFRHKRVIIQGYPLHTHTHSYIHYGLYKGFTNLGIETYWVDVSKGWSFDPSVTSLDFADSLVLSECHASMDIVPKVDTSTYMIHNLGNKPDGPMKYAGPQLYAGVRRLIDWRHNPMYHWDDVIYKFEVNDEKMKWVGPGCRFEKSEDYDRIYLNWATDLLPEEINFQDRFIPREKKITWIGTIGGGKGGIDDSLDTVAKYDNRPVLREFRRACQEQDVVFESSCPWLTPKTAEQQKEIVQKSWVVPDFRHPSMLSWGYIPCRVMKNISYGQVGATNSKAVHEFFKGNVVFNEDPYQLFYDCQEKMLDHDFILGQMEMVKENHTYINRCKSIIEVVNES